MDGMSAAAVRDFHSTLNTKLLFFFPPKKNSLITWEFPVNVESLWPTATLLYFSGRKSRTQLKDVTWIVWKSQFNRKKSTEKITPWNHAFQWGTTRFYPKKHKNAKMKIKKKLPLSRTHSKQNSSCHWILSILSFNTDFSFFLPIHQMPRQKGREMCLQSWKVNTHYWCYQSRKLLCSLTANYRNKNSAVWFQH